MPPKHDMMHQTLTIIIATKSYCKKWEMQEQQTCSHLTTTPSTFKKSHKLTVSSQNLQQALQQTTTQNAPDDEIAAVQHL